MIRPRMMLSITVAVVAITTAILTAYSQVVGGVHLGFPLAGTLAAPGWWPEKAIESALSCIRLTPSDLSLRTDYVPRDSFRLWGVDQVMRHPAEMTGLLSTASQDVFGDSITSKPDAQRPTRNVKWDDLVRLVLGPTVHLAPFEPTDSELARNAPILTPVRVDSPYDRLKQGNAPAGVSPAWQKFLSTVSIALADSGWIDTVLCDLSKEERQFVVARVPLLVQDDETDRDKSEEVLDSLQKVEDADAKHFADLGARIHWKWVHEHGVPLVAHLLRGIPLSAPANDSLWRAQKSPVVYHGPSGDIIFGTIGSDHYTGSPAIVIDPGGNDIYDLRALPMGRHRLILDYGGDDTYNAPSGNDLGAARFGWSIQVDFAGEDTYRGGDFTMGSGWFGVGVLMDLQGRDVYIGDQHTQGAGSFGIGLLYDGGQGIDQYTARLYSQGFGFSGGLGILADAGGNDLYTAGGKYEDVLRYRDHYVSLSQGFGYGIRPHFSGGIGLLLDKNGNDVYTADIFGQGCSYWWGFGGLLDGAGNDQYSAYQYAQGSATHMTAGCLYDVAGDDRYESKGVSQGCGHDWAVGMLIDSSGNDRYIATDLSQAAGSANGIGILIDGTGNDGYYATSMLNTQGYGNPRREYGSVGLFLDLGGIDRYDGPGHDAGIWLGESLWGVGVDADTAWVRLK